MSLHGDLFGYFPTEGQALAAVILVLLVALAVALFLLMKYFDPNWPARGGRGGR